MEIKKGLKYTKSHEWILESAQNTIKIGITDYAQEQMGDIVYVDLPTVGDGVSIGDVFTNIESVKAVSDVYSPVNGTISAVNEELIDAPESINSSPYDSWLAEIENIDDSETFMSDAEYEEYCESL